MMKRTLPVVADVIIFLLEGEGPNARREAPKDRVQISTLGSCQEGDRVLVDGLAVGTRRETPRSENPDLGHPDLRVGTCATRRFDIATRGMMGKRLTYAEVTGKVGQTAV